MDDDDPRGEDEVAAGYDEAEALRDQERERAPVRVAPVPEQMTWTW